MIVRAVRLLFRVGGGLVFAASVFQGCAGTERLTPLAPAAVEAAVETATSTHLRQIPVADTASFSNVEAVFSGRTGDRISLVVVFESAAATKQVLGVSFTGPDRSVPITIRNVVVIYGGPDRVARGHAIRSALVMRLGR